MREKRSAKARRMRKLRRNPTGLKAGTSAK